MVSQDQGNHFRFDALHYVSIHTQFRSAICCLCCRDFVLSFESFNLIWTSVYMFTVFRVLGLLLRSAAAAGHHKFYKQSLLAQHYMHTTTRNALWCCLVHLSSHHSLRHPDRSTTPTNKCSWNILSAKIWTWQWVMILTTVDEWVYNNWNGSNEYKQKNSKLFRQFVVQEGQQ